MRVLAPGQVPVLGGNDGLLLVAIDSSIELDGVRLARVDRALTGDALRHIPGGRSYRLYVAPAGRYAWRSADVAGVRLPLAQDRELAFTVAPGVLSYVGDLVFRPVDGVAGRSMRASATLANRSLAAIDWLEYHHPRVLADHRLHFAGHYPDPFPEFYANERGIAASARVTGGAVPPAPASPPPVAMSRLLQAPRFQTVQLNPAGDLLALQVREGPQAWRIDLVDTLTGTAQALASGPEEFGALRWAGDRRLVISAGTRAYRRQVRVVHIDDSVGERRVRVVTLRRSGEVLAALPGAQGPLIFASLSRGRMRVHRVDVSSQAAADAADFGYRHRLNIGMADEQHWETDLAGHLRLARVRRAGADYWMHGRDGVFRPVLRLDDDLGLDPVGLSADGDRLYALSEKGRGQRDAVVFDLVRGAITETVFSRPGVDVDALMLDEKRQPIGVSYHRHGQRVSEYFQDRDALLARQLEQAFPGQAVHAAARSASGERWMVWTEAADQPPALFFVDVATGRVQPIAGNTPWLDGLAFAPTRLVPLRSHDGRRLDAFLTLPRVAGPAPLVVMPHGGPIGIADTLHFDAKVQFLAGLGYAVLQVNFRGSAGYGVAFREAGYQAHGTRIEDDIDAAIAHVVEHFPVDAARMCMVGASYGGYSGLVAAVRWPDRFRCVVSIGGVSDRLLFFTASDTGTTPQGRAELEKVMGNPLRQFEAIRASSPLYHYRALRTPVMLAHGLEDRRVDFEHSRRLARMLELAGRPPVTLAFEDEGHGLVSPANIDRLWTGVAGFLQQSLAAGTQAQAKGGHVVAGRP